MKVITIGEAQDLRNMIFDKIISSLKTFKTYKIYRYEMKNKSIIFVSNTGEDRDNGESLSDAIALIGIKFNKSLIRMDI